MARTGLGRGLDVLLGSAPPVTPSTISTGALDIPLEKIQPNRQQPRQHFDQASIAELATHNAFRLSWHEEVGDIGRQLLGNQGEGRVEQSAFGQPGSSRRRACAGGG